MPCAWLMSLGGLFFYKQRQGSGGGGGNGERLGEGERGDTVVGMQYM